MAKFQSRLSNLLTATTALVLLGAGLFSAVAQGQTTGSEINVPGTVQLPKRFVKRLISQPDPDQRLLMAMGQFERIDLDGNGVSQEDIDRKGLMDAAKTRSATIQRYVAYDLNADSLVTRKEVEDAIVWSNRQYLSRSRSDTSAGIHLKRRIKQQLEPFEKADLNRDDKLDAAELFKLAKTQADAKLQSGIESRYRSLEGSIMSLDFNSDGVVSEQEFVAAISKLTPESLNIRSADATVRVVERGCVAPQVRPEEKLVLVGTNNGSVLSNVTILGQDKPTWTAEVVIEAGNEPLYVVLTSNNPFIWSFTGATSRVNRVVLSSRLGSHQSIAGSGLTGIDKSKVSFVVGRDCLTPFHKAGGLKEAKAKARVRDVTGREPDYVLTQRGVARLTLPDGPAEKAVSGNQPRVRIKVGSQSLPVSPSGRVKIDVSKVVSQKPATDYEVLPLHAGLAQLLGEGKIELMERGTYRIKQKIRIPGGLHGGYRVNFLLPKGVPEPVGDPGHSCIFSEALGRDIGHSGVCR